MLYGEFENYALRITATSSRDQWVKSLQITVSQLHNFKDSRFP